jgi:Sec-independent protein translocase protein TatA
MVSTFFEIGWIIIIIIIIIFLGKTRLSEQRVIFISCNSFFKKMIFCIKI